MSQFHIVLSTSPSSLQNSLTYLCFLPSFLGLRCQGAGRQSGPWSSLQIGLAEAAVNLPAPLSSAMAMPDDTPCGGFVYLLKLHPALHLEFCCQHCRSCSGTLWCLPSSPSSRPGTSVSRAEREGRTMPPSYCFSHSPIFSPSIKFS